MAIVIKPMSTILQNWQTRSAAATSAYQSGVQNTQKDWAQLTAASATNWSAGVSSAAANGMFAKGVNAAGTQKWKANSLSLGVVRYPQGVQSPAAATAFTNGFGPIAQVIAGLTIPARLPTGDPGNLQRVSIIDAALHQYAQQNPV
jgi:hypothetical protein